MKSKRTRALAIAAGAAVAMVSLAACGGSGSGDSAKDGGKVTTINVWDPYPQNDAKSDWAKYLDACAPAGTTIKRTTAATSLVLSG